MLLQTELDDRILRFDGVSIVDVDTAAYAIVKGIKPSMLRVENKSEEINLFNEQVVEENRIKLNCQEPISLNMAWQMPEKYIKMDLDEYVSDVFANKVHSLGYSDAQIELAMIRVSEELFEIKRRAMIDFTKIVIYILDVFREKNIVWGVGRGSSCASYILFLLGLHVVDSIKYEVPMEEFFHD